ncbi:6-phospho-beta-glucosidase [Sinanaerobacter chloroacetimidivorans]|jgi:6-phospho-beta-glucosidase|uniref:6-phospho-beta-glucosidase n=1 Tax=Sinanaerobacter chloroacetimidivorans TaxID=2818044 RepID=A0A8J8AZG9_9FIRM|nr:6-phospho-beta-glucosidase [Sinanaerobacter chloroacetimidivorans]MBR0596513.1 6-phospho-beta-glucosidase [Sinanaerobacter chloroacetimidivorans]
MKLCILGGGGSRAMILAKSLLQQAKSLSISEIVFMDCHQEGLRIFGGMAQKAASLIDPDVRVSCTTDPIEAISNADYVITTVRVGGDSSRVQNEKIALKHGVLGQETTGAGGFAMAVSTIPVLREYCSLIRQYAKKEVMVFNFSNPSGLVTQAMRDLGYDFVYGVCDAPSGFLRQIANVRKGQSEDYKMDVFGLNHLSYFTSVREKGEDITAELLRDPLLYTETDMRYFEPDLPQKWGMLFNEYLYYFYYREQAVANILRKGSTRGESIMGINERMFEELKQCNAEKDFDRMLEIYSKYNHEREISYMATESSVKRNESAAPLFDLYSREDGGYAGIALAFIKAKIAGKESEMVLSVPNQGTVEWLRDSDVVEVTCSIGPSGATPKKGMKELPESAVELIRTMKLYERMAARSILEKDRNLAIEALMVHPLINSYSLAKALITDYLNLNVNGFDDWRA